MEIVYQFFKHISDNYGISLAMVFLFSVIILFGAYFLMRTFPEIISAYVEKKLLEPKSGKSWKFWSFATIPLCCTQYFQSTRFFTFKKQQYVKSITRHPFLRLRKFPVANAQRPLRAGPKTRSLRSKPLYHC